MGKRLRILLSYNNAGIDDSLVGGVIAPEDVAEGYVMEDQWTSYGWNVLSLDDGNDYDQVMAALKTMEDWDPNDRRPLIVVGKTTKGWWPSAQDGQIAGFGEQLVGYHSHPYELKMNEPYFVALAETFEQRFGVEFDGIRERSGSRRARTADSVQDQHRRGDVGVEPEWPWRLAGEPAGGDRRFAE